MYVGLRVQALRPQDLQRLLESLIDQAPANGGVHHAGAGATPSPGGGGGGGLGNGGTPSPIDLC